MLFFEEESGQFVEKTVKYDQNMWVVLVYTDKEDWSSLEEQAPYVYDSIEELTKALKNQAKEFTDYVKDGDTLVIRKVTCATLKEG